MSEDDDESDAPTADLGADADVDGVPLARVASRLTWGMAHGEVVDREGDTVIRTGDGPQELGTVLESVDISYFESRQEFERSIRDVIGYGPVPTGADE